MAAQKREKPAAAETANGLPKTDRLGGTINRKIIKSNTRRQIRRPNCFERPATWVRRRRYPFACIDCGFDKRGAYVVKLFFSRRDYLVWGPYSNIRDAVAQREHLQQAFAEASR